MNLRIMLLLLLASNLPSLSLAEDSQWVEDANFQQCLTEISTNNNWKAPEEFTKIKCHNKSIKSSIGIQKFTNIRNLSLYKNKIKTFNLSGLKKLESLNVARNGLVNIQIENLPSLKSLFLFGNKLSTLNLNSFPNLETLKVNSNRLESFSYETLKSLRKVYLFDNKLEHLDIYRFPQLDYMDARQNPMPDKLYEEMDIMKDVTILHDGNADDWD